MSLQDLALICFAIGVGVHLLVTQPTICDFARVVGAVGGIVLGIILILQGRV